MKTPVFIVYKHGRPSMKGIHAEIKDSELLIKSLRFNGYIRYSNGQKERQKIEEPDCAGKIVARWGSRAPIKTDKGSVVYNRNEFVAIANSKGQCRKHLREKGVSIPTTFLVGEDMGNMKYPVIGRPEHHGQGRHAYICKTKKEVDAAIKAGCTYFSEIYPKTREIRVHCFMGKVLAIMEKPRPNDDKILWNRAQNDAPFTVLDRKDWPLHACALALETCEVLGLDYSGVDVMLDAGPNHPKSVICELNSAPTLINSPYVMGKYIQAFKWLFASDKRRPKWDFRKFKKADSLAWKNEQLDPNFEIPQDKQLA